jgi:aminopeptidase N
MHRARDEPAVKATFALSIDAPEGMVVLSNTAVATSAPTTHTGSDGDALGPWVTHTFRPTRPISTYLVAFALGEFEHVEAVSSTGVVVRVYTTRGRLGEAAFGLDTAARAVGFLEGYFACPYPFDGLLQLVSIPSFAFYAMENAGLICSEDRYLLVREGSTSVDGCCYAAYIICHEIVHQVRGGVGGSPPPPLDPPPTPVGRGRPPACPSMGLSFLPFQPPTPCHSGLGTL